MGVVTKRISAIEFDAQKETATWKVRDAVTNKMIKDLCGKEINGVIEGRIADIEEHIARKDKQFKKLEKMIDNQKYQENKLNDTAEKVDVIEEHIQ